MYIDAVCTYSLSTGKVLSYLQTTSASCSFGYNDYAGNIKAETSEQHINATNCVPFKHGIAILAGSGARVLQAGPITSVEHEPATGKVTITGSGPWALMAKRVMWPDTLINTSANGGHIAAKNDENMPTAARMYYKDPIPFIIHDLIQRFGADIANPNFSLMGRSPNEGTKHERTYEALSFPILADAISNLLEVPDAPFMHLASRTENNHIKTYVYFTDKTDVSIHEFTADDNLINVTKWALTEDSGNTRNRAFFKSSRNDETTDLFARADDTEWQEEFGLKIDVVDTSHNDIKIPATLKNYAVAASRASNALKMSIECVPEPTVVWWLPGDTLRLRVQSTFYNTAFFEGTIDTVSYDSDGSIKFDVVNVAKGQETDNTLLPVKGRTVIGAVKDLEKNQRVNR